MAPTANKRSARSARSRASRDAEFNRALHAGRLDRGRIIPEQTRRPDPIPGLHAYGCMCDPCRTMRQASPEANRALHRHLAIVRENPVPEPAAQVVTCTGEYDCPCRRHTSARAIDHAKHTVKTPDGEREYVSLDLVIRSFDSIRWRDAERKVLKRELKKIRAADWMPDGMTMRSDHARRAQACLVALYQIGLDRGQLHVPRPSSRELGQLIGVTHQSAINYLTELTEHGFIELHPAAIRLAPGAVVKHGSRRVERKVAKARRLQLVAEAYPAGVPVSDSPYIILDDINVHLGKGERKLTPADLQQARRDLEDMGLMECIERSKPEKIGEKWTSMPSTWIRHDKPVTPKTAFPGAELLRKLRHRGRKMVGRRTEMDLKVEKLLTCPHWAETEMAA